MKKVILTCAVMLISCLSHAAFVDWAINLGKTDYANKSYYVFAAADSADVLKTLGAFTESSATTLTDLALDSGTLNAKAGKASGSKLDVGDNTSLFMLVLNDTLEVGKTFIYDTMDVSDKLYTPPANTPGQFVAYNANFTKSGTIDVPEPTSALLLIVGGALMALRRKQK